jgi:competence protein ComEC
MGGGAAFGVAAAIWAGVLLGGRIGAGAALVAGALALPLAWIARRAPPRTGTVALALALLGAASARGFSWHARLDHEARRVIEDVPVWLDVRVVDHPARESDLPTALLEVRGTGQALPAGSKLRLRLPPESAIEWGDTLRLLARLDAPRESRFPGGFSALDAAHAQDVVAMGRALATDEARAPTSPMRATVTRWRRGIEACFVRRLSSATRELVMPLVVGDRSGLGTELDARLKAAGLIHLLALSGLHVVWMAGVARGLAALAGGGLRMRAAAGAACALLYAAIAGPIPSLARAVASELVAAIAQWRGRALDPLQALAVSAATLLAWKPGWSGDLGFQLSCAATLGLVALGRPTGAAIERLSPRIARALAPLLPTATAQVTALPLMLWRFHALPWTGLGANLLAVPISELLLAAAWLGVVLDALLPGAGGWCFAACEGLASALRAVADHAARAPLALLPTGSSPWPAILAALGATGVVIATLGPRDLRRARHEPSPARARIAGAGGLALALAILIGATAPTLVPRPGRWWLVVLDVGQGDALAVASPRGWWLVDTGPRTATYDAGTAVVLPFLRWAGVRRLEALVLTHDHGDHTGGAAAVREALPVARAVVTAAAPAPRVAPPGARAVVAGDTLAEDPRAIVRWPATGFHHRDPNAGSLVLEIGAGAGRALLLADVDSTVEALLALTGSPAVLKVAHHGAAGSSGAAWLARVHPAFAVISCGRRNPFGHPDPGAIARLLASGAQLRRTDADATVWLELGDRRAREISWRSGAAPDAFDLAPAPTRGGSLAAAPARW